MTEIKVDNVQNAAGSGKPNFPISPTHSTGSALSTLNTCQYDTTARVVTVVNDGGTNKYAIDGVTAPTITLLRGVTYVFDLSDSSNSNHPLVFQNSGTSYTTGITSSGTAGSANATVTFAVASDAPLTGLTYLCSVHGSGMGAAVTTSDPKNGALLWDNTNSAVKVFIDNEFKQIQLNSSSGGGVAWGGDRGFTIGGEPSSGGRFNSIEYCDITSLGNNTDFGDLTAACYEGAAVSNSTRILVSHGHPSSNNYVNSVDYFATASSANGVDFGDLLSNKSDSMPCADGTKGIFMGGSTAYNVRVDSIDQFTVATTGNATDFGDLTTLAASGGSSNDATRGIRFSGSQAYPSTQSNVIDYITMASAGNATDFGDPVNTLLNGSTGVVSDNTTGVVGGGYQPNSESNVMQYITIQTTGNAQDFGDLLTTVRGIGATSNGTRGIFMGGYTGSAYINHIQYITIANTGNATDFGDIVPANNYDPCGASGAAS